MRGIATPIVLVALLNGLSASSQAQSPTPELGAAQRRALPSLDIEKLSATRDRPLFAPDRRPQPPPAATPIASEPKMERDPEPDLSLTGIIRLEAPFTLVILEDNDASESVVVRSGGSYRGWRVDAVSDGTVRLSNGSHELLLKLFQP